MATLGQYLFANISGIKAAAHLQVPHAKKTWRRVQTSVSTLKVRHAALLVMLLGDGNQRDIKSCAAIKLLISVCEGGSVALVRYLLIE